jgi:hypothetical protein
MLIRRIRILGGLAVAGTLVFAAPAFAQHEQRGPGPGASHYDGRYQHNHAYPARGYVVGGRPEGAIAVNHLGQRYWYGGGVWYGARGRGWVVVGPPIGVFVPVLPPYYTTVWFGGLPYYYANDTYYTWRDADQGYQVVDPPGAATATTEPPATPDIYMYPRNGQSDDQQSKDRYECHRWAADQTGFDPTRVSGGVAPTDSRGKREDYFRAMGACLEGRGYSVK